ncbi:MAG: hypothetical protein CSB16_00930 [Clostridiales bacterium]|nr:MAG: hypothetical protein CSB16_00930 [Clostridiales bacterium]
MNILYITYIDFGKFSSGSSVRPQKMYDAFLKEGHNVKLLECQQNRYLTRNKKVFDTIKWLSKNTPDICYIESPSGPIFNYIDLTLIKKISKKNIPIGYFYRDAFWLLEKKDNKKENLKSKIIKRMNIHQLSFLEKFCDIVYMPSNMMIETFKLKTSFKKMDTLPPAMSSYKKNIRENRNDILNAIYVGGVSFEYGTDKLIKAFEILNESEIICNLILLCRENEYKSFFRDEKDYDWLKVRHVEGEQLNKYYDMADFGVSPKTKYFYNDFAISVKLFEYMEHDLPIISSNVKEMGDFVEKNKIGIVYEDSVDGLVKSVRSVVANRDQLRVFSKNIENIAKNHYWTSRVKKIIYDLTKSNNK